MEAEERESLANKIQSVARDYYWGADSSPFERGFMSGLRMAACIVRDNHPKEDDE